MTPKVSIVIAFLNGANFIGEAIDSVLAQTFTDWELILVDDGSVDASTEIARALADAHENVRYLAHPGGGNRGLAESRGLGSDAAKGDYLIFLDHDDVLYPQALERMIALIEVNPQVGAVFAGILYWAFDPSLGPESFLTYGKLGNGRVAGRKVLRDLIRSDTHHPGTCGTLYRRGSYKSARDSVAIYPGMYEDTAMLFSLLTRNDVYLTNEPVAAYRLHPASMCQRAKADGSLADSGYSSDRQRFLRWAAQNIPMDMVSRAVLAASLIRLEVQRRIRGTRTSRAFSAA